MEQHVPNSVGPSEDTHASPLEMSHLAIALPMVFQATCNQLQMIKSMLHIILSRDFTSILTLQESQLAKMVKT